MKKASLIILVLVFSSISLLTKAQPSSPSTTCIGHIEGSILAFEAAQLGTCSFLTPGDIVWQNYNNNWSEASICWYFTSCFYGSDDCFSCLVDRILPLQKALLCETQSRYYFCLGLPVVDSSLCDNAACNFYREKWEFAMNCFAKASEQCGISLDTIHKMGLDFGTLHMSGKTDKVLIYPNPGNGEITIDLELLTDDNLTVSINNILGETMVQSAIQMRQGKNLSKMNLSNLSNGVYFIKITGSNGFKNEQKILITK